MQDQNIVNKRIELENIEEVAKILLKKQKELDIKDKQGKEELQYSNSQTQKYKISMNNISVEIHYKDGVKIKKDNQFDWFITEMYANRSKIERIWINYHAMYYPNYEVGVISQTAVEEYNIYIYENS